MSRELLLGSTRTRSQDDDEHDALSTNQIAPGKLTTAQLHEYRGGARGSIAPGKLTLAEAGMAWRTAPGKLSLADVGRAEVQRKAAAPVDGEAAPEVQVAAQRGVSGSGGRLPHFESIQWAFGAHDLSGIEAHVGGQAKDACDAIGAEAYATGNKIAFASAPSLHTAAHEAAHVVQQRAGVQLVGGVGKEGDSYERQADAIADRVVAGKTAVDLLPQLSGQLAPTTPAVQRDRKKQPPPPKKPPPPLTNEWVEIVTPAKVFRETSPAGATDRTFEKTAELIKGKGRMSLVGDETAKYLRLVTIDADPNAEPKWIERTRAKKITPTVLTGKTVAIVARTEVEIPLDTRLEVKADDIEKGRIQVEVKGKLEWIGRSHVVVYDASKELPAIKSGDAASEDAAWTKFAQLFNDEFTVTTKDKREILPFGTKLDGPTAKLKFTEHQRESLVRFFTTKLIPDLLFTDDSGVGGCTAQERILIAAHMFTYGKHQKLDANGDLADPDKLHGRNCGHWVTTVNNYAGVTPSGTGVYGDFDQAGNIILGNGRLDGGPAGKLVKSDQLPTTEGEQQNGPIDPDTEHGKTRKKEDDAIDPEPSPLTTCGPMQTGPVVAPNTCGGTMAPKKTPPARKVGRFPGVPFEKFADFKPGDWLWFYNANGSNSGGHSVIFYAWVNGKPDPTTDPTSKVKYVEALCYGQPTPAHGGNLVPYKLGEQFALKNPDWNSIFQITARWSAAKDSAPADTKEEVLPMRDSVRKQAADANKGFMASRKAVRGKGAQAALDEEKLRAWLRESNEWFIGELFARLSTGQLTLLHEINADDDLVTLVALWERLRGLHLNAGILTKSIKANTKKPFMIHGSGSVAGESKGKLSGKLASVDHIRKHKADFEQKVDPQGP